MAQNVKPEAERLALEAGHTVLYTPPHHSDLQPIELVWANIKGEVGRQYDTDTIFGIVRERLDAAFDNQTSFSIHGCILKAEKFLLELNKFIRTTGQDSSDDSGSDSDDEDGSVSSDDDE